MHSIIRNFGNAHASMCNMLLNNMADDRKEKGADFDFGAKVMHT